MKYRDFINTSLPCDFYNGVVLIAARSITIEGGRDLLFSWKKATRRALRQTLSLFISVSVVLSLFQPLNALASMNPVPLSDPPKNVFKEDFNDGDAVGWVTYAAANGSNAWQVNQGQYQVTGSDGTKSVYQDASFTDLVYEADFTVGGYNDDSTGVLFRVSDHLSGNVADGYNGYYVSLRVDKKAMLGRVTGNNEWKELQTVSIPWTSGHLKVVAVGNHIQVFVNDMRSPVIDYVDQDGKEITEGGAIGLRTWWGTSTIDNIVVKEYAGTQTSAPVFSLAGGHYESSQLVTLSSAADDAVIRYTTDGSEPDRQSRIYRSPIPVSSAKMIKAYAERAGEMVSDTVTALYTVGDAEVRLEPGFSDSDADGWTAYDGWRSGEWSATGATYDAWSVTDAAYTVFDSSGDKLLIDLDEESFILEGDIDLHEGWQSSGFVFRVSDPGAGPDKMNGYFVGIGNSGVLEIGRMDSAGNNGSGSWTGIAKLGVPVNPDSPNHLKVIGAGTKYYIELNGIPVYTFTDSTYTWGNIGLRAWNDNGLVSYDNIRYTKLTLLPDIPEEPVDPVDPQLPSATFTEDFNDGNTDSWTTYGGTFTVIDGKYVAKNGSGTKAVASSTSFSNFVYEADISLGSGTNDHNAGLIFRVQDPTVGTDNLKGYYAGIGINGRVQVGKFNNNWKELASIPYPISPNTDYRMKVIADGRNIDVYINEEWVVSVVDRTYTTGAIGVRNFLIDATYDNLSVTETVPTDLPSFDWSWVQGAVFVPTNAVNQLQQWHQYDHDINDREMYYAHLYGINLVRVYIHNLLWEYDRENLLANMEDFLQIADKYDIKVEVVLFDDCWNDSPEFRPNGDYPAPVFGKHNSQWVEGPGDAYKAQYNAADGVVKQKLEDYVKGVVSRFKNDERIAFWNVFNEPSNGESGLMDQVTKQIMNDSRIWIREVGPIHAMSSTGGQFSGAPFSDFITYHPYESNYPIPAEYGDPREVLADEVMNRLTQSVPGVVSGFGKKGLGFVMWEFGIGRDNTRFYWGTDVNPAKEEMEVPFHGIVYPDGHPWDINDIKAMIGEERFNQLPVYNVSYYHDDNFARLAKKSITPSIDFDLGDERSTGAPDASVGMDKDHFSVRWVGTVQPAETGEYTIYADSDHIARVWVDGRKIIDKTSGQREEVKASLPLAAHEKYAVKVEYVHAAGDASLHILWSGPGTGKQVMLPVYADKAVESISFGEDSIRLKAGESRQLIPQFTPADASNQNVIWSSNKPGIAAVNSDGVVKGVAKGNATIQATAVDGGMSATVNIEVDTGTTFTNPIVQVSGGGGSADPSIVFKDGYYYYVKSMRDNSIVVAKARRLQDIGSAPRVTVYTPPSGTMYSKDLWAPELQYINGKWYIYFAADDGDNANHRMYVLEGNSQDPQGTYTFKGKITDSTDRWAIDGAVLQTDDGALYFIWSGWEGTVNVKQNLYIAPMSNPWTISGPRVMISTPAEAWELHGQPYINEGPELLKKDGKIFIVYSASGSWTDDYALGMLTNTNGNVLDPASWTKSGPVFSKAPTAYGPGHNTFTVSPDGKEDWLVYHAVKNSGGGWANRSVRAQKFTWNADGTPNFGTPVSYGAAIVEPSGTPAIERYQYEAEDAHVGGKAAIVSEGNASGGKVVGKLDTSSDYIEFSVDVERGGEYTLIVMADNGSSGSGLAEQSVRINDGAAQSVSHPSFGWGYYNPSSIDVHLESGSNTVRIAGKMNFAQVDYIVLERIEVDSGSKPVEDLLPDKTSVSVRAGASVTVEVAARPIAGTDKTLTAVSSDSQVAEVAWSGKDTATGRAFYTITGIKPGTATVEITSKSNSGLKIKLPINVLGEAREPDLTGFTIDHFDSSQLDSAWSIVKQNKANWSLGKNPGALTINTTATDVYQDNNSQDNVFLWEVSKSSDFEIIAKMTMPITANHEQAGMFVWKDADNFVKLGHVWSNDRIIETAYELNRTYRKPGNYAAHPGGDTMTLKIRKMGNVYTTFYWDGYQWVQASDPVTADLGDVKVGFYANSIVSGVSKQASFDYFAVREMTGGVDVTPKTAALKVGESLQLTNTGASGDHVIWASSNTGIAEVNASGLVQAKAPGRTVIIAKDLSGNYSSQAVITVEDTSAVPEVLYEEDFEQSNISDWETYGGTWTISSDHALTVNSGAGFKALLKGKHFTDYIYEADVTLVSGTEAGLIFRTANAAVGPDAQDSYYIGINAANKSAVFGEMKGGIWREIAARPLPIHLNQTYRIKVVADDEHIQIYINDNPLNLNPYPKFDLTDNAHPGTGALGFRTWNAEAKFDNVKVSSYAEQLPEQTYSNPDLLPGIADPYVLFHEGVYYLYGTHTADWPGMQNGIKAYTSTDLVHWEDQGYALSKEDTWGNNRFWAPEVIEKNGTFYMYYAVEERLAVATSDSPLGPFVQDVQAPLHLNTPEIDAHIFTDDDGKSYMYFVRFNNNNHILVAEMNEDMKSIKEDTVQFVFAPTQNWELSTKQPAAKINEGPFVIKHNGTYYMTYSGNHFESPDYGVGYATAPTPTGPWTKYEYNPIMKSNTLVPGAGHHSLIYSPDGSELFMIYHTHYRVGQTEPRKLAIDRVQFVPQESGPDAMEVWGPTVTPQPMPSSKSIEPEPVAVERIAVSGVGGVASITRKGGTLQLLAEVLPADASDKRVNWSMINGNAYADLSLAGLLTAKGNGTVIIRATSVSTPDVFGEISVVISGQQAASGGGGTPSTPGGPSSPSPGTPDSGTKPSDTAGQVNGSRLQLTEAKPDANGTVFYEVPADLFIQAAAKAADGTVAIIAASGTADRAAIALKAELLDAASKQGIKQLSLDLGFARVAFDPSAFPSELAASGTLTLKVSRNGEQPDLTGVDGLSGVIAAYEVVLEHDGKIVSGLAPRTLRIGLDYKLESGQDPEHVIVFFIDDEGRPRIIVNGAYHSDTGKAELSASDLGTYAVAYRDISFEDLGHAAWARQGISALAARGILQGTGDNKFQPGAKVSRAEFVSMLIRSFELSDAKASSSFTDAKTGAWYYEAVASAQKLGIVNGKSDGSFGVSDDISRQEMAAMAYRAAQLAGIQFSSSSIDASFLDQEKISSYAQEAVAAMKASGIINGKGNNLFAPQDSATRAEAAIIIYHLFNLIP